MTEPTIPYQRAEFYQRLSEVQGRLAELRYIDRATEYLAGRQAQWWHDDVSGKITMEIQFGETVPFTRTYDLGLPFFHWPWETRWGLEEEVNECLGEFADEAGTWAADGIAALTARIEPLAHPSASRYEQDVIAPLDGAYWRLEDEVSTNFGKLAGSIDHWEGEAAENFRSYFYYPFEDTLRSQKSLFEALAGGVVTAKAIVEATQHSLMNAVHYTWHLLYQQLELRSRATVEDATASVPIIAAAGLASVISAGATRRLWGVGMEAVAAGISVASSTIPTAVDVSIFGSTADQLLGALDGAIANIEENMAAQYDDLAGELHGVATRVGHLRRGEYGSDGRLVPTRPNIVDGVDADIFFLPDAD